MTSASKVKKVLDTLPKNQWIELPEIHSYIESHIDFDEEDMQPISLDRNYFKWKRTLHGIISKLKNDKLVDHIELVGAKKSPTGKRCEAKYYFK